MTDEYPEREDPVAEEPEHPERYRFSTEFGVMELIPPSPWPRDLPRLSPEEQLEAAMRYLRKRYGAATDPDVIRGIERVTGETYRDGEWHKPEDKE